MAADEDDVAGLLRTLTLSTVHDGSSSSKEQEEAADQWRRSIYFKVCSSDKTVRFKTLQNIFLSTWTKYGILNITPMQEDIFMAEFNTLDAVERIFDDGPWNFLNDFIVLERIIPNLPLHCYSFNSITVWVQLHNIPLNLLSIPIIENLLDGIGRLSPIDPLAPLSWKKFARVQVILKTDFRIKSMARSPLSDGSYVVAFLKYERLHRYCVVCCGIGHELLSCPLRKKVLQHLQSTCSPALRNKLLTSIAPKLNDSVKSYSSAHPLEAVFHPDSAYNYVANKRISPSVSQQVCSPSNVIGHNTISSSDATDYNAPFYGLPTQKNPILLDASHVCSTQPNLSTVPSLANRSTTLLSAVQHSTSMKTKKLALHSSANTRFSPNVSQKVCEHSEIEDNLFTPNKVGDAATGLLSEVSNISSKGVNSVIHTSPPVVYTCTDTRLRTTSSALTSIGKIKMASQKLPANNSVDTIVSPEVPSVSVQRSKRPFSDIITDTLPNPATISDFDTIMVDVSEKMGVPAQSRQRKHFKRNCSKSVDIPNKQQIDEDTLLTGYSTWPTFSQANYRSIPIVSQVVCALPTSDPTFVADTVSNSCIFSDILNATPKWGDGLEKPQINSSSKSAADFSSLNTENWDSHSVSDLVTTTSSSVLHASASVHNQLQYDSKLKQVLKNALYDPAAADPNKVFNLVFEDGIHIHSSAETSTTGITSSRSHHSDNSNNKRQCISAINSTQDALHCPDTVLLKSSLKTSHLLNSQVVTGVDQLPLTK